MGSSDSGGAGYIQSPQQQALFNLAYPLAQKAMQFGLGNIQYGTGGAAATPTTTPASSDFMPLNYSDPRYSLGGGWDYMASSPMYTAAGSARTMPTWGGGGTPFGGGGTGGINIASLWNIPSYNIPSPEYMMPTGQTMGSISPAVWSGIMQPYQKVESQLMETLGAGGQLGSAMGGFSGQGAAGLGKYWAEAAPGIGMQAWNMISPALQQGWGAGLQQAQNLWAEQMQQYKYPWQAAPSLISMGMPFPYVQQPSGSPMAGMGSLLSGMGSLMGGMGGMGGAGAMGGGK